MRKKIYTTGEVARRLGVHKNTIFYWLHTGKVKEPDRDEIFNGRIWTERDVERLEKLKISAKRTTGSRPKAKNQKGVWGKEFFPKE